MKNTHTSGTAPRLSRMIEDQFTNPIPKNTPHVNHSLCTTFDSNRLSEGYAIKYVVSGRERYEVNGQSHKVTNGKFLVVSHGSKCRFIVDEKKTVEGLCLYLDSGTTAKVWQTLHQPQDTLLDNAAPTEAGSPPDFYENVFSAARTPGMAKQISGILCAVKNGNATEDSLHDEVFYALAEELCLMQLHAKNHLQSLPAQKKSTREELYRRLLLSRDFLHDNLTEQLNLSQLADAASLSEYHFLRQFKAAFGQSPYQYLLQLRLQYAQELLGAGMMSIAEVAQACGFKEVQAFSKIFRKTVGTAPSLYQRELQN